MDIKIGSKVQYRGGNVIFGIKQGTDQPLIVPMHPIDGVYNPNVKFTYVWQIIPSVNDGNLYIIGHHLGVQKEFFKLNKEVFGDVDVSGLTANGRYIYVSEQEIRLYEETMGESNSVSKENKEESNSVDDETFEEEQQFAEVEKKIDIEKQSAKEPINYGTEKPYFTSRTCPLGIMMETVALPKVLKSIKMSEPFTIESSSGGVENGRGGDYLFLTPENKLFIEPKELFSDKYQLLNTVEVKKIGKDGASYTLPNKVSEYITFLENENIELRCKLHL